MKRIATSLALALLLLIFPPSAARARDPGDIDTGVRIGGVPRFGTSPAPRREHETLYESVERELDRGTGRIEDEQSWELRRLREDLDERLGRVWPRRESERFELERDRRLRVEGRAAQLERDRRRELASALERERLGARPAAPSSGMTGYPLADVVAEDRLTLTRARRSLRRDLLALRRERAAALEAAKGPAERQAVEQRFERRRAARVGQFEQLRRRVVGEASR